MDLRTLRRHPGMGPVVDYISQLGDGRRRTVGRIGAGEFGRVEEGAREISVGVKLGSSSSSAKTAHPEDLRVRTHKSA